jgi:hypothetical protein
MAKDDITGVMSWAANFFHSQLKSPSGSSAMEYARKRGLTLQDRILSDPDRRQRYNAELAHSDGRAAPSAADVASAGIAVPADGTDVAVAAVDSDFARAVPAAAAQTTVCASAPLEYRLATSASGSGLIFGAWPSQPNSR